MDYVDDYVDGDAAAGGLGADQGELVLGAVDEDDPGPQAAGVAGTGLVERGGDHVRGVLADGPGQPLARAFGPGRSGREPCLPPGGAITSCGLAPAGSAS